jgi:hypothetical protein
MKNSFVFGEEMLAAWNFRKLLTLSSLMDADLETRT